jgi:hypothetical protein
MPLSPTLKQPTIHYGGARIQTRPKPDPISTKDFETKKTTKPSGELTPNDIGSLVKIITTDGVEICDVLVCFVAGGDEENMMFVEMEHFTPGFQVNTGMRAVVRRPIWDK